MLLGGRAVRIGAGPRWYAARTQGRVEKAIAAPRERGVECFLLLSSGNSDWADRRRSVTTLLRAMLRVRHMMLCRPNAPTLGALLPSRSRATR